MTQTDVEIPYTKYYGNLVDLVAKGFIWAVCYKCNTILSDREVKKKCCNTCGKLDFKQVLFRKKTDFC